MLQIDRMNHQNEIEGNIHKIPLVKYILRVWVDSYVRFARANIHEEHNPWAIIMIRAPFHPHEDKRDTPKITKAMCPTEE